MGRAGGAGGMAEGGLHPGGVGEEETGEVHCVEVSCGAAMRRERMWELWA